MPNTALKLITKTVLAPIYNNEHIAIMERRKRGLQCENDGGNWGLQKKINLAQLHPPPLKPG